MPLSRLELGFQCATLLVQAVLSAMSIYLHEHKLSQLYQFTVIMAQIMDI